MPQNLMEQLHFAHVKFELQLVRADGNAYQNLLWTVLSKIHPKFGPVKPHGNAGDRKNDGFCRESGIYYQAYAPEEPESKMIEAAEKAKTDFTGLLSFWQSISPIREYRFAFNDKGRGSYPDLFKTLAEIKKTHGIECTPFMFNHLLDAFKNLAPLDQVDIVGILPNAANLQTIDFKEFSDLLQHVLGSDAGVPRDEILRAPGFDEKIKFNGLTPKVGLLLTKGSWQSGLVEKFFERQSAVSRQAVRDKLSAMYSKLRASAPPLSGDQIFFALLDLIAPTRNSRAQDAVIVLLAFFFESCDVYEEPTLA